MKLRFTPRAIESIAAIADDIRLHNPAAAQLVRAAIYASLQDIVNVGRPQRTSGVRSS